MDNNTLYATHKGVVLVGDMEIPCAVLNNGKRVFIQREIVGLLTGTKKGGFDRYLKPKNLQPYIPDKFKENGLVQTLFNFRIDNRTAQAFEATDLIDICMMYINANSDGCLLTNQKHLATQALVIVSAFAKTGVIAVIDEATGYNKDKKRAKDELQKFLSGFMRTEAAALVKRFEDTFFEVIYKMRGWTWNYTHKHPSVVGKWINDIVYERIAPIVFSELQKRNPKTERGNRKYKHHQFLTEEIGIPKLLNHLASIETLAKVSNYDWNRFMDMVDIAFPKQYQQLKLFYDDIYIDSIQEDKEQETKYEIDPFLSQALNYNPKDKEPSE